MNDGHPFKLLSSSEMEVVLNLQPVDIARRICPERARLLAALTKET